MTSIYDAWDNGDRHEIRQRFARRDEIIRMAREAGLDPNALWPGSLSVTTMWVEIFAVLVAAAEREACAKECDIQASYGNDDERFGARQCAHAIRTRGQA